MKALNLIRTEAFRVSASRTRKLINRKRRIHYRLRERNWTDQPRPMFTASNIHYELADRTRGLGPGGIGAGHLLARQTEQVVRTFLAGRWVRPADQYS